MGVRSVWPLLLTLLWLALPIAAAGQLPAGWPRMLPPVRAPAGQMEAWFMGNTTLLFRVGDEAIMIDGFLSRPPLRDVALERRLVSNERLIRSCMGQVGIRLRGSTEGAALTAVLVAHNHYDHAMDVGAVARLTGAPIAGSASTAQIAYGGRGAAGGALSFVWLDPTLEHRFGDFFVRPFWFRHGRPNLYYGVARSPLPPDARAGQYLDTGSYGFLIRHGGFRVLVHSSAGYRRDAYPGVRADVVFVALGSPGLVLPRRARRYWRAVVAPVRPRLVIPVHWDNFFTGLDHGLRPGIGSHMAMTRLQAEAERGPALRLMPLFQPVNLPLASSGGLDSYLRRPSAPPPECVRVAGTGSPAMGP